MNFFGTDGIRGTYGKQITDETAFLLGKSLALLGGEQPIVLICRDTRLSGERLFNALAQGVYGGGGNVINLGILPTNSVGHFVRKLGGDYGVMISASHNPPSDNGLKVFDRYGVKLCLSKQEAVSRTMASLQKTIPKTGKVFEPVFYDIDGIYCDDILSLMKPNLHGVSVALDCCYGAAYRVGGRLFEAAGADVKAFCNSNRGRLINCNCGATCTRFLEEKMKGGGFDIGFAFDGDCDRLAVFEKDGLVPNNKVFFAMAKYLKERGRLTKNTVVGTTLTNGGVERALAEQGIGFVRGDVGDANVFRTMAAHGLNFGGEESGHYLLADYATGSDALISALFVCEIFREKGSLLQYAADCSDLPFFKTDIALTENNASLATDVSLNAVSSRVSELFPDCRLVLRKSGTEPKIRVYAEGERCDEVWRCVAATLAK